MMCGRRSRGSGLRNRTVMFLLLGFLTACGDTLGASHDDSPQIPPSIVVSDDAVEGAESSGASETDLGTITPSQDPQAFTADTFDFLEMPLGGDPTDTVCEAVGSSTAPGSNPPGNSVASGSSSSFLVGDSTFADAAGRLGIGSAYPGRGFVQVPTCPNAPPNPTDLPPVGFTGSVIIGVSLWDASAPDVSAYVDAVEKYRAAGFPVVVVEVPTAYGPDYAPLEEFESLNNRVASALECRLMSSPLREVEVRHFEDGSGDYVHPSEDGVSTLLANLDSADLLECAPA